MRFLKSNSITKITSAFIFLAVVFTIVSQQKWNKSNDVIGGDVRGYYAYLPALFIHNDLKFENLDVYKKEKGYEVWVKQDEQKRFFIKYSSGMSILYSPFFLASHAIAKSSGDSATGFTPIYKKGLICSAVFYLIIGLVFLSKFLLRFFEDRVVSICLLILYLGTNLFQYETGHMTYAHSYSFALIALFLYSTVKWIDTPKIKWAIWIGITAGLIILIRPIDIVFLLFIPFFNVNSFADLKARFALLWSKKAHLAVAIAFLILILVPQMLYFKHIFGHFIYYSYNKEGFFFLTPHLLDSMFSYRNGWLVYSPVMILALLGLIFMRSFSKQFNWFAPLTFLLYFYIIAAWWCWWYAGFGNRAYINVYPILAIPLCAFITFILQKGWLVRTSFNLLVVGFIVLNFFQSWQFEKGIIHWGYMSKDAYWNVWGRTTHSQLQDLYLNPPHLDKALEGRDVISVFDVDTLSVTRNSFERVKANDSIYKRFVQPNTVYKGKQALFVPKDPFAIQNSFNVPKKTTHIYLSAWIRTDANLRIVVSVDGETPYYKASNSIEETDGEWKKLVLLAELPRDVDLKCLNYFIWNNQQADYCLDELEVACLDVQVQIIER